MDLDRGDVARRFVRDLSELRQRAGRPSYSMLERLSGHELKRATMSDVLNGNRVRIPEWRFVAVFVTACRAAAEENGLDAGELGTVADWKHHWDSASHGVLDARFPGSGYPSPSGRERPGLTVADPRETAPPSGDDGTSADDQDNGKVAESVPPVWGLVPPRLNDFVGREPWLAGIRQALADNGQASAVVLQGLCGIGKTQLAAEYAHRAASEYDLVWWIPCAGRESAHQAMADLESALGIADAPRVPGENQYAGLFDLLQQGERQGRWLLIFDNANEPDLVRNLIPPINGHVLITSRNSRWEAIGEMLELDVFSREESVEFLRRRMRRVTAAAAHQLADAVGDLPILLEHAAESQIAISQYIERLDRDPLGLLDGQPADYQGTIAGEWQAVLSQLRDRVPDSLDLLACLCFFGDEQIPRESLERGSYLHDISIHDLLRDPIRRNRAIMMLRRAGLLRVRADTRTLEVHQATRCVVRAMVARAGADQAERSRHDVHLLLAAADPLDPEDPASWRSYVELREHVAQSGAGACADESVRRLVINLARFLTAAGDPWAALTLADDALSRWTADKAGHPSGASGAGLAMRQAKAAALLACGRGRDAFQLQQETLAAMRSAAGNWEREVILLERLTGARHRMAGNFRAAQVADEESVVAHVTEFGHDHPYAFPALNNVIADLALNGEYASATREAMRVYGDCLDFYNDAGYPAVLFHRNALGWCQWLSGRHDEAIDILAEVRAGYRAAADEGIIDKNHLWCLANEVDYAIARRDKGLIADELRVLADDMYQLRRRCWRALGADHPQTLAATVALGSILRRSAQRAYEALRILAEAERRYESALPDHPYAHACRGFAVAVRCQASGTAGDAAAAAGGGKGMPRRHPATELEDVAARLADSVGETHPLTLTAVSSLANVLADTGEPAAGLDRGLAALAGFRSGLGPDHPHALACAANVMTIRARLGDEADSGDSRARYEAAVGADHLDVRLFTEGKLIYLDFTPLPL